MAAPLYFLPGIFAAQLFPQQKLNRALLAERGLDGVLADVDYGDLTKNEISSEGPSGTPGMLLSARPVKAGQAKGGQEPRRFGYHKQDKHVTWTPQRRGDVWIGIDTLAPPAPADLLRKDPLGGHLTRLDGREWLVPVIRCPVSAQNDLPSNLIYTDDERWVSKIKPHYLPLWERTGPIADSVWGDPDDTFSDVDCIELAIDALALNYRVSRLEQSVLGIVDKHNLMTVLKAVIDWPKVLAQIERQKKTSPAPTSTSSPPGDAGSCPATAPAAETCT